MGRFRSIQILRAAAAVGVVSVHALTAWTLHPNAWYGLGNAGVDVFFVISGFVMTLTADRAGSAGQFLRARAFRVVPIYWLYSLPLVVTAVAANTFTPAVFARTFLFWLGSSPTGTQPLLAVGWTLCFEVWFYLMVGCAVAFGRRAWVAWGALCGSFFVLGIVTHLAVFSFLGSPLFVEFALGAAVARAKWRAGGVAGLAAVAVGLVALTWFGLFGAGVHYNAQMDFDPAIGFRRLILAGLPAALLVWGAIQCEPWLSGRMAAPLAFIGDASYSIYLAHPAVIDFLHPAKPPPPEQLRDAAAAIVLCVAVGIVSYVMIERPMLWLIRRKKAPQLLPASASA